MHFLFNALGILLVYPVPAIRNLPLSAARWLAKLAVRSKRWALVYVAAMFYALPALLVFIHQMTK